MRPHDSRPSKRSARSAVRTYLEDHLGWLRGYPVGQAEGGVAWVAVPRLVFSRRAHVVEVTREHVRRASYGRRRAATRFPRALPEAVGALDVWITRVEARLSFLKGVLHDGADLPDHAALAPAFQFRRGLVERLGSMAADPVVGRLVHALTWMHLDDAELGGVLDHFDAHRPWFSSVLRGVPGHEGVLTAVVVLDLIADGVPVPDALDVLADPRAWTMPLSGGKEFRNLLDLRSRLPEKPVHPIHPPGVPCGPLVCNWLRSLCEWPVSARRRAVDLLGALVATPLVDAWETWWASAVEMERELRRNHRNERKDFWKDYRRCLRDEMAMPPPALELPRWGALVQEVVDALSDDAARALHDVLREMPAIRDAHAPRKEFIVEFLRRYRRLELGATVVTSLAALATMLGAMPRDAYAARCLAGSLFEQIVEFMHEDPIAPEARPRLIAFLSRLGAEGSDAIPQFEYWYGEVIRALLESNADIEDAWRFLSGLEALEIYPTRPSVRLMLALSRGDPERLVRYLRQWCRDDENDGDWASLVLGLEDDGAWVRLIGEALDHDEASAAIDAVRLLHALQRLGGETIPAVVDRASSFDDEAAYPPVLGRALARLASVDPSFEKTVERVRSTVAPDPGRWARELAAIEARLDGDLDGTRRLHLDRRAVTLRGWIASPPEPSAAQRARLAAKLDRRRVRLTLDARRADIEAALTARVREHVGHVSADALTRSRLELLAHVCRLPPKPRALALELVRRAGEGGPPVDFRDHAANEAFLTRMRERGIRMAPWIDGTWTGPGDCGNLRLERDPFGFLEMGRPFDTCLAPGAFNFFSTVANAVDINKQMIVERRDGKLVARCLIALTGEGGIVAFHAYSHGDDTFLGRVSMFVTGLARAMKAEVVSGGVVQSLVAPSWYDDGPVDLRDPAGRIDWQAALSEQSLTPANILDHITRVVRRDGEATDLDGDGVPVPAMLRDALRWRGLIETRALCRPILERLVEVDLDVDTRVDLAEIALPVNHALAVSLVEPLLRPTARRQLIARWRHQSVIDVLWRAGEPERALRLLRQTRPRTVRRWLDEDPARMWSAAQCFRALERPTAARELFHALAESGMESAAYALRELE